MLVGQLLYIFSLVFCRKDVMFLISLLSGRSAWLRVLKCTPTKRVVVLDTPGTAGTAETGVVLVAAKAGVNYEPAVGQLVLVHTVWHHISIWNKHNSDSSIRLNILIVQFVSI